MRSQYSITLVHGTFARGAAWTRENSRLCSTLRAKLCGPIDFHPFSWSGGNSPSARIKAAERLKAHLQQTTDANPRAAHYVIAHSHGGNIALYALQDEELQRKIRGVVCLSTPFLHVRNRQLPRAALDYAAWSLAFFVSIPLFLVGGMALSDMLEGWPDWILAVLLWPVFFYALFAALFMVGTVQTRWMAMADAIRERHHHPRLPPGKLLILRTVGDEASAVLGTAHFVNWMLGWSTSRIYRLHDFPFARLPRPTTVRWLLTAILFLFLNGVVFAGLLLVAFNLLLAYLFAAVFVAALYRESTVWFLLGLATFAIFLPAIILISLLLLLPFGLQFAVSNILLEISAEPTPVGNWTILQLRGDESAYAQLAGKPDRARRAANSGTEERIESEAKKGTGSLMHSSVYDDLDAIARITSWIAKRRGGFHRQRR